MNGYVITIEGIDAAGHMAVLERLKSRFRGNFFFEEPWDGPKADEIRYLLKNSFCDGNEKRLTLKEVQKLFIVNCVAQWRRDIIPRLKRGEIGFSSRCFLSTLAYYKAGGGDWRWMFTENARKFGSLNFPRPELCIILTLPPEVAEQRLFESSRTLDAFKTQRDFQERLTAAYLTLADKEDAMGMRIIKVDATPSEEEVCNAVVAHIRSFMRARAKCLMTS